jgi:hypothetical protein
VAVLACLTLAVGVSAAQAQYFGRNKVQYRGFTFSILKTAHFDLYYYPEEAEAAALAGRLAERWYARLSRFFSHDLRGRQPLILYAASAHFQQTNAVEGLIGEGTGGLTEALKRRIVLPMSGSLGDTDHVLGHELVHAFQFDMTGNDPRESTVEAPEILYYPLWFVEGMAEYVTLGGVDTQTAMWLRDAAIREQLPHIKDLDDPKYFPYRWGHAFWAFIGARYGDRAVASLLRSGANPRADLNGLARQLGTTPDALTSDWHAEIQRATALVAGEIQETMLMSDARLVVSKATGGGRYNIGPRVSPDGREVAFFSERGRFSVDLYIADAATGKIVRRLSSTSADPHFDNLEFLNSAGAWSPDGKLLAVAATKSGRPIIALLDARSGRVRRELTLPGLDDLLNPSFSPDGAAIVFSGNRGGLMDLYRITIASGDLEQLTSDPFADLEPVMTPDGTTVVFVTERFSANLDLLQPGPLRLARLDLATKDVQLISGFLGGKHISPQVSSDGKTITFIADPDGVSNLYRMPIEGGPVSRLSSWLTGVAGITASSPALSIATTTDRLAFSVFEGDGHSIYVLDESDTVQTVAPPAHRRAAILPGRTTPSGDVHALLSDLRRGLPPPAAGVTREGYGSRLMLDAIGQPVVGAGVSSFGPYVTGGVSAYFSDMLGDKMLFMAAQAGGTLADLGGQIVYVNRQRRWNWAAAVEAIPYLTGEMRIQEDPSRNETVVTERLVRQTSRGVFATAAYPFSAASRFEVSAGARQLTFTREDRTRTYLTSTEELIDHQATRERIGDPLYLAEPSAALVYDTSLFGATGPLYGARSRLEIGQSFGSLKFTSVLFDARRYFMPVRPVTIAVRALHFGRYGRDGEHQQLADLYAGHQEFVRGYPLGSFDDLSDCADRDAGGTCAAFNNLRGSRLAVFNLEVRAPLVGLFKGEIEYGRVPIDVVGFFDAGLAWSQTALPSLVGGTREIVRSAGVAARVNAFGFLIVEVAASRPLDRPTRGWQWQVGFKQGF